MRPHFRGGLVGWLEFNGAFNTLAGRIKGQWEELRKCTTE